VEETKAKILKVLDAIPHGVLYSTTDWHRILSHDKREIRVALDELEADGKKRFKGVAARTSRSTSCGEDVRG